MYIEKVKKFLDSPKFSIPYLIIASSGIVYLSILIFLNSLPFINLEISLFLENYKKIIALIFAFISLVYFYIDRKNVEKNANKVLIGEIIVVIIIAIEILINYAI